MFANGDRVYLRISSMKGVITFGRHGKLISMNFGPFLILRNVGGIAYDLFTLFQIF